MSVRAKRTSYTKYTKRLHIQAHTDRIEAHDDTQEASCEEEDDCCWVHVGDDLANDVGASAQCGAKAVWVDLDEEEYDQSASARDPNKPQPAWSTATKEELEKRKKMDKEAQQYVTKRVTTLQMLPSSIEEIAKEERSGIRIQ